MAIRTRKSDPSKPARILVYGVEGCGKSTLGARAEKPIFISPEGGTDRLTTSSGGPVDEFVGIDNWKSLIAAVKSLIEEDHDFKTLVLDSADWIEGLAHREIIGTSNKTITTVNGGYGAGYRQSQNLHQSLISDLSELRDKRNMNIIVTAHAHVRPVKDPEMLDDYDAFEIKCHEMVSSLWREWVDGLFFVRFRTFTKTNEDSTKARALTDGTRVLYTVKQPAFQAKNRYGMPPEITFTLDFWSEFMKYAKNGTIEESASSIKSEITDMYLLLKDDKTKTGVQEAMEKAGEEIKKLVAIRNRLKEVTASQGV